MGRFLALKTTGSTYALNRQSFGSSRMLVLHSLSKAAHAILGEGYALINFGFTAAVSSDAIAFTLPPALGNLSLSPLSFRKQLKTCVLAATCCFEVNS